METEPVCETSVDLNHMKQLAVEVLLNFVATKLQDIMLLLLLMILMMMTIIIIIIIIIIMCILQFLLPDGRRVSPVA